MRIRFAVDGGLAHFPGLTEPVEISTESLSAEEAADLARKLDRAWPHGLPPDADFEAVPDARRYTVTIEKAPGTEETRVFPEPAADSSVSELLATLRGHRRRAREVEIDRGVYIVKGAAPKAGTRLTPERLKDDLRRLNRRSEDSGEHESAEENAGAPAPRHMLLSELTDEALAALAGRQAMPPATRGSSLSDVSRDHDRHLTEETETTRIVSRDPEVMGGELVFAGTRVPVQILVDHLVAGDSLDQFLEAIPTVSREQAVAYLRASVAAVDAQRRGEAESP